METNGILDKHTKIFELRMAGYNLSDIAAQLGYAGPSAVSRVLNKYLFQEDPVGEMANEYRRKLLEEYEADRQMIEILKVAISAETDANKRLDMTSKYLKAMKELRQEEAKLTGAYQPERVEQSVSITPEEALKALK